MAPRPNNPERAATQFVADKVFLAGFNLLVQRFVVADQSADELECRENVARPHQHAGDDQFLDRVRIGAWGIENNNAFLAHGLDRDVVGTGAGAARAHHTGRDRQLVHGLRAHENGVRVRPCHLQPCSLRAGEQALSWKWN